MQKEQTTSRAYIAARALDTPFWALFNLIPFILYKDLYATPLLLSILITLKPLVSIASSYWTTLCSGKSVVRSLLIARWLAFIPFLIFPFFPTSPLLVTIYGTFMFFQVGMMPGWMELLKLHLRENKRDRIVSTMQAIGYLGGGLLPFFFGFLLDEWEGIWRWMFAGAAFIALLANIFITKADKSATYHEDGQKGQLSKPWIKSFELLRSRPDFLKFQIGFMFLGASLMVIQPSLPVFFVDRLNLSYTEMGAAITLCKGIGFATSSPFWVKAIRKIDLFRLSSFIALFATGFTGLLFLSTQNHLLLFAAYLIYGFMQSGSELVWNLSGPLFAGSEKSPSYSNVNVMAVGIRGAIVPSVGGLILAYFGAEAAIVASGILALIAAERMYYYSTASRFSLPLAGKPPQEVV